MEITAHLNNLINISWGATFPAGKFANRPVYFLNEALTNIRENPYLAGLTTMMMNILFLRLAVRIVDTTFKRWNVKTTGFTMCAGMSSIMLGITGMNVVFNHFFRPNLSPLISGVIAASSCVGTFLYMAKY